MTNENDISQCLCRLDAFLKAPSGMVLRDNAPQILDICKSIKLQSQQMQQSIELYTVNSRYRLESMREKIMIAQKQLDKILSIINETQRDLTSTLSNPTITRDSNAMIVVNYMQQNILSLQKIFMECYTRLLML